MQSDNFSIIKFNFSSELIWKVGEYGGHRINNRWYVYINSLYRWDGVGEPQIPTINQNTGEITKWNFENQNKVKDFLNQYLDVIIQENIRVQQGGNPDYESSIVGTQRIIFDFEIVDESLVRNSFKSIYRMILTIDERKNIIAGSLELFHNWKYVDEPVKNQKDKLCFLFAFMKEKDYIFNFEGNTNSYLENENIKYYEKMKGQIDINKFLKAFFAYALVPVFQNRSNFIESGYIDNLGRMEKRRVLTNTQKLNKNNKLNHLLKWFFLFVKPKLLIGSEKGQHLNS